MNRYVALRGMANQREDPGRGLEDLDVDALVLRVRWNGETLQVETVARSPLG